MQLRKVLAITISFSMITTIFTGCGDKEEATTSDSTQVAEETVEVKSEQTASTNSTESVVQGLGERPDIYTIDWIKRSMPKNIKVSLSRKATGGTMNVDCYMGTGNHNYLISSNPEIKMTDTQLNDLIDSIVEIQQKDVANLTKEDRLNAAIFDNLSDDGIYTMKYDVYFSNDLYTRFQIGNTEIFNYKVNIGSDIAQDLSTENTEKTSEENTEEAVKEEAVKEAAVAEVAKVNEDDIEASRFMAALGINNILDPDAVITETTHSDIDGVTYDIIKVAKLSDDDTQGACFYVNTNTYEIGYIAPLSGEYEGIIFKIADEEMPDIFWTNNSKQADINQLEEINLMYYIVKNSVDVTKTTAADTTSSESEEYEEFVYDTSLKENIDTSDDEYNHIINPDGAETYELKDKDSEPKIYRYANDEVKDSVELKDLENYSGFKGSSDRYKIVTQEGFGGEEEISLKEAFERIKSKER